jgi:hypothetical protein
MSVNILIGTNVIKNGQPSKCENVTLVLAIAALLSIRNFVNDDNLEVKTYFLILIFWEGLGFRFTFL